jgi:Kef-type K+ transport system membrane component KefB
MSEFELSRLLLAIVILLYSALTLGQVFEKLRMPRVIGEISAGLVLGPSLLGAVAPDLYQGIFLAFSDQERLLSVFYWLGLILLMFSAGFSLTTSFSKSDYGLVLALIIGGICLPFFFGLSISSYIPNGASPPHMAFALVIAVAASVTSIPVLTKIFIDIGIDSRKFARLTLTASAIQDLLLWIALSVALGLQEGAALSSHGILLIALLTFGYTAVTIMVVPKLIRAAGRAVSTQTPDEGFVGYIMLVCLALVSVAGLLHVNLVFGALLAGLVIGRFSHPRIISAKQTIAVVAGWFFAPIYFSLVGLKINLPAYFDLWLLLGFLVTSSCVKVVSVMVATRFYGVKWKESLDFGITMNARGGPGIVLASLAYASNIIDEKLFVTFVLTSIITSLIAGVWLKWRFLTEASRFV